MEASAMKCSNLNLMPKLRKNKRIESRWGVKYHTAVKNAVFGALPVPYMPLEPPPSLSECISEPESLYVCKQCKDCFRFLSSFEDHNARHSWILGFWCQHCFVTICTHMTTGGSPCSDCLKLDRDKRLYLRGRGLHKSQKLGAVRVFYNQCQFFAHLKTHHVSLVDMGDLMLMPWPTNIGNDWSPDLDITCEALMEDAFMLRIHVVDLLKAKNVENTWWQLATKAGDDDNPVARIVKGYKGRFFFNSIVPTTREQFSTLNSSYATSNNSRLSPDIEIIEHVQSNDKKKNLSDTVPFDSDPCVLENEDNPCTANDIAFVDCGPISRCFESEMPTSNVPRKHTTIFVKSGPDSANTFQPANIVKINSKRKRFKSILAKRSSPDIGLSYGNTTITPKRDAKAGTGNPIDTQFWKDSEYRFSAGKLSSNLSAEGAKKPLPETEAHATARPGNVSGVSKPQIGRSKSDRVKQNVHALAVTSGQKILTFPKSMDLNAIINQLPSHLVSSKRIVLIGQDSEGLGARNKQESSSKKIIQVVPDRSLRKNVKALQTKLMPLHVSSGAGKDADKDNNNQKAQLDPPSGKTQQSSHSNKIVYRNGRKFVIKSSYAAKKTTNSNLKSNLIILATDAEGAKQGAPENDASAITPTGSNESENTLPAEKISALQNDVVSPLTPSPSPSELSSSSSCDVQSKQTTTVLKNTGKIEPGVPQLNFERKDTTSSILNSNESTENLSFHKGEDENLYLDIKFFNQKPHQTVADTCVMITKCKQEMLNEFFHLSYSDLKKRYDHMQHVNDEIVNVMNFVADNVVKENLKAINILQHVLKHCIDKCADTRANTSDADVLLDEWESVHASSAEKSKCSTCDKILKPKSYIPGFAALAKDDGIYCSCYRNICHKCNTYEGNLMSFVAHRNYHEKRKPYVCPDCYRRFPSFKSLDFHTWTVCFHTLKKRVLGCKVCEIDGFRDMESIARHFAIMHSHNKIACDICCLVLPSYSEYKKHSKEAHSSVSQEPIRLTLCKLGQCIVRYENYMSHMEKHLVVQRVAWFKCPLCPFINLEAKRIMPHLQNKHLERLPEILSLGTLWDILPVEVVMAVLRANPQLITGNAKRKFINTRDEPFEDGTMLPKIINTRTITSEVFERGADETEEDPSTNTVNRSPTRSTAKVRQNGGWSGPTDSSDIRRLVDTKSKSKDDSTKAEALPKILDVRSMADGSSDRLPKRSSSLDTMTKISDDKDESTLRASLEKKHSDETETNEETSEGSEEGMSEEKSQEAEDRSFEEDKRVASSIKEIITEEAKSSINSFSLNHFLLGSSEATSSEVEDVGIPSGSITKPSDAAIEANSNVRTSVSSTITKPPQGSNESSKEKKVSDKMQAEMLDEKQPEPPVRSQKQAESASTRSAISKPPPLARIPQHVLERSAYKEFGAQVVRAGKDKIAQQQNSGSQKSASQVMRRIALNSSQEKDVDFSCHLCGELINTSWSVISRHYERKHSQDHKLFVVTPKLLRMTREFVNGGYKEAFAGKKRKVDPVPTNTKRRRRWTPKKYAESKITDSSGVGLCVQQETAEDGEGNFKCKKCNQRCTDMADLREHIASNHRIKGRYLICLECGENFVVAPSLQMHLKAFHGIENPITYMARNTSYAPDNVDDLEIEGKTTIANQCHVCMAVFEDKAAVDKHLRVHGMAFLNRKRIEARNALKSPEKKDAVAGDKRIPVKVAVKERVRRDNPSETILEKINASI